MAAITPQTAHWGTSTPDLTAHTPDSTQVYKEMNENVSIIIENDSAGDITATVKNQVQDKWGSAVTTQDQAITVGAGKVIPLSGPFLAKYFLDSDKELTIEYSDTVDIVTRAWYRGP
jgi:hypothetical protein